jgi:hypothetical protein
VAARAARRVVSAVAFSVRFAESLRAPPELLARAHEVLLDVADSLANVPSTSALWDAMRAGNAELNLGGWQFEYRVDHALRRIVVVDARKLGRARTG